LTVTVRCLSEARAIALKIRSRANPRSVDDGPYFAAGQGPFILRGSLRPHLRMTVVD
jgi:hypothetical protein